MKELVEVIAKALVDNPDKVTVTQTVEDDGTIVLSLNVAKEDMGKVIIEGTIEFIGEGAFSGCRNLAI